jgi:hypothetical protein
MARTKGAKDKKPRKKRISQKAFIINLNSDKTRIAYAAQEVKFR